VLHAVAMTIILTFDQNLSQGIRWIKSVDHRTYPLTQPSVKIVYCLSIEDRSKKALIILSEGDLEEKKALIPEDKAPGRISCVSSRLQWRNVLSQHYESVDLIFVL
jgi:hypothetical protein